MPKPDRELKEGKTDEDVSTKSGDFFFPIARDYRLQRLATEWPLLFKGVQVLFKRQRSLQCCHSLSGCVHPRTLLCPWTCLSHLLSYSIQSPEMWSWEGGWVFLTMGKANQQTVVFPLGVLKINVFSVGQAAEGWMLEASCPDAFLNVLDHTILPTTSLCRLACDFVS